MVAWVPYQAGLYSAEILLNGAVRVASVTAGWWRFYANMTMLCQRPSEPMMPLSDLAGFGRSVRMGMRS
jgi:hypothetical protein